MNIREKNEFQHQLLLALQQDFEVVEIPSILRSAQEENLPMDILTTLHRDYGHGLHQVMGEYYFFPVPQEQGEETIHYFSTMLNLENEIREDCLPQLRQAVCALNFYLQCGNFVVNPSGTLLGFRFVTPILGDMSFAQALQMLNLNIGHSLDLAEQYVDSLIRLAHGTLRLEDFMYQMPKL